MGETRQRPAGVSEVPSSDVAAAIARSCRELGVVLTRDELDAGPSSAESEAAASDDQFAAVHEQLILRFVAPALGAALDDRTLDRARGEVFLDECIGYASDITAVAISAVLPEAAELGLDELADRLAEELDRVEQLDGDGDGDGGTGPLGASGALLDVGGPATGLPVRPAQPLERDDPRDLVPHDPCDLVPHDPPDSARADAHDAARIHEPAPVGGNAPGPAWDLVADPPCAHVRVEVERRPCREFGGPGDRESVADPRRGPTGRTIAEPLGPRPEEDHDEIASTSDNRQGRPCRVTALPPRPRGPPPRGAPLSASRRGHSRSRLQARRRPTAPRAAPPPPDGTGPGGSFVLETRRLERRGWDEWTDPAPVAADVPGIGPVERRRGLTDVNLPLVSFRSTHRFLTDGTTLAEADGRVGDVEAVAGARTAGRSWGQIDMVLGVSEQAVRERFGTTPRPRSARG